MIRRSNMLLSIVLLICAWQAVPAAAGWDPGTPIQGTACAMKTGELAVPDEVTVYTNEEVAFLSDAVDVDNWDDPTGADGIHCDWSYVPQGGSTPVEMGKCGTYWGSRCTHGDYQSQTVTYSWNRPGTYVVTCVTDDCPVLGDDEGIEDTITVTVLYNPSAGIHFTYDVNGNRATMRDDRGTTVYAHDRLMRLARVTEPDAKYVEAVYNLQNQRISMRDHFAGTTAYTYDAHGRLYQLTDRNSGVTEYAYYPNGALQQMNYPNGAHAEYLYNERNWLTELTHRKANNVLIAQFIYEYDPNSWGKNGTRTGMSEEILTPDNTTSMRADITYAYDDAYRLTGEERTGYAPYNGTPYTYAKAYTYDLVGNRLTKVDGSTTTYYHYDYDYPGGLSANKLMDYGSSNTPGSTANTLLAYDSAGNLTTETPPNSAPVTGYEWDWANRLVRTTLGGAQVAQFAYDGTGLRRSATLGTNDTVGFQYAGRSVIAEEDEQGILSAFYTQGQLGIQSLESGSVMKYYYGDGIDSVRSLTDSQSLPGVTDAYAYDVWGNLLGHLGNTQQPYQYIGELGYYDHYQSSSFRMLHLGARYYDPVVGRFVSRDPTRQEDNTYAYVRNTPVLIVDPNGTFGTPLECALGAISAVAPVIDHMHDNNTKGKPYPPATRCKLQCGMVCGCVLGLAGPLVGVLGGVFVCTSECADYCTKPVCHDFPPTQPAPPSPPPYYNPGPSLGDPIQPKPIVPGGSPESYL